MLSKPPTSATALEPTTPDGPGSTSRVALGSGMSRPYVRTAGGVPSGVAGGSHALLRMSKKRTSLRRTPLTSEPPMTTSAPR